MTPESKTRSGNCHNGHPQASQRRLGPRTNKFPSHPLDWEQAVSQAAAIEGDEANLGAHQVETWDEATTAWTVPEADAWGDNPVEPPNERPDVAVEEAIDTETPGDETTTKTPTGEGHIGVHAEEADVIVKEEEELEVPNEETVEVTDVAWGLKNTTPKVVDEDSGATQVPITTLVLDQELCFEGMPDLEDVDSEEIMGEEPPMDVSLTEGPPAFFEAQIHQDEIQYWVAMFAWF